MFLKRLGPDPHANGARTVGCVGCPDIWELADGDFAIIGADLTALTATLALPVAASGNYITALFKAGDHVNCAAHCRDHVHRIARLHAHGQLHGQILGRRTVERTPEVIPVRW